METVHGTARVHTQSFTRAEREALLKKNRVELYEVAVDESKFFQPWPMQKVRSVAALLRKWFRNVLEHLPEATDEQLRSVIFEEHPREMKTLTPFIEKYVITTMVATSRFIVDGLFRDFLLLARESQKCMAQAKGDEVKYKHLMGDYMRRNTVYFNVRDFVQLRGVSEVPVAPLPEDLQALLTSRRAAGERPGRALLSRDKMTAMKEQHKVLYESMLAAKTAPHTSYDGVSTLAFGEEEATAS